MNHKTAFITAAALTAFVLIIVGGIAATMTSKALAMNPVAAATDAATQVPTALPSLTATRVKIIAPQVTFLSADQADKIALKLSPAGKLTEQSSLVNYKGKMAYEVLLNLGAVYVDAFTGKVLFNGIGLAAAPATSVPTVDSGSGGGQSVATGPAANSPAPAPAVMPPSGGHDDHEHEGDNHSNGGGSGGGNGGGEHDGGD